MELTEYAVRVIDGFFVRFSGDGIFIYTKSDIDAVVDGASKGKLAMPNESIVAALRKWEKEGRLILNEESDQEYIKLNKVYWLNRIN